MTPFFFCSGESLDKRVVRAAFLEAAGALEVVELAVDLHPGELAQRNRLRAGRLVNGAFDALRRLLRCRGTWSSGRAYTGAPPFDLTIRSKRDSQTQSASSTSRTFAASWSALNGLGRKLIPGSRRSRGCDRFLEITGDENDFRLRAGLAEPIGEIAAADFRHHHVGEKQIDLGGRRVRVMRRLASSPWAASSTS